MKKQLLLMSLAFMMSLSVNSITASAAETIFADEGSTSSWEWAANSIRWAYNEGIIAGKTSENGIIFDAEGKITRAEAVTMLVQWMGINPEEYLDSGMVFTDVPEEEWYAKFVKAAYENGLMKGKGNGIFDPDGYLTRAEAATMLVETQGWIADAPDAGFTDVVEGEWYIKYINTAHAHGVVSGKSKNIFAPADVVTRAEFVRMISNVWPVEDAAIFYSNYNYNESGQLAECITYDSQDNTVYNRLMYSYDEKGLLCEEREYNSAGELEETTIYTYDTEGRLLSEQNQDAEGTVNNCIEYVYDVEGMLQTEKTTWSDGEYYVNNYDASGRRTSHSNHDKYGNLEYYLEYTYSEDGLETTITKIQGTTSSVWYVIKDIYNEKNELIEEWSYRADGAVSLERWTYDEAGNKIQWASYDSYGVMDYLWETYEYDDAGRCVTYTVYSYMIIEE